jgi:hypothetical protein
MRRGAITDLGDFARAQGARIGRTAVAYLSGGGAGPAPFAAGAVAAHAIHADVRGFTLLKGRAALADRCLCFALPPRTVAPEWAAARGAGPSAGAAGSTARSPAAVGLRRAGRAALSAVHAGSAGSGRRAPVALVTREIASGSTAGPVGAITGHTLRRPGAGRALGQLRHAPGRIRRGEAEGVHRRAVEVIGALGRAVQALPVADVGTGRGRRLGR